MLLLILLAFYIINFSFIIKAQSCSTINNILVNSCSKGSYYNSMTCTCEECRSRLINENICYSDSPVSLYEDVGVSCKFENGTTIDCNQCTGDYYVTELDIEGKWLGYLMCIIMETSSPKGESDQFQLYTLGNENRQNSGIRSDTTAIVPNYNSDLDSYYNDSCLNKTYEKSCQYLANLCVLSLYYYRNRFCQSINVLSNILKENGIINDHLLKFNGNSESILEQIIDIETSFDSKDNEIHINLIDLYIAK